MDIYDLGGEWRVSQVGKSRSYPAAIPGTVHEDLIRAKAIPDPYVRENEIDLQWIGKAAWKYSRSFKLPESVFERDRVLLHCDGLDTLASIVINGRKIGTTDNQFRTWEFDIRKCLKKGVNKIEVLFSSTIPIIEKGQKKRYLRDVGSAPWEPRGRGWVRKMPCNYGWDWGPSLVTCGVFRPITIVAFDTARLDDVALQQSHKGKKNVSLKINAGVDRVSKAGLRMAVTVSFNGKAVAETENPVKGKSSTALLSVKNPHLWWPNGMGEQPLYDVTVDLLDADGGLLDTWTRRIGLRTLELRRKKDKWGESFEFLANGVPFFAKGANWIPADAVYSRITPQQYGSLLASAADANMNMLRVWGGGFYEEDVFYELCDQLGLTVWQDFMFACAAYPSFDKSFMASVKAEAEDNVKRLRHHACMALWCGNNELEMFVVGDTPPKMPWKDYKLLFDKLLPSVVKRLSPDITYWPCSPHSPVGDRANHANPRCGDAHLWSVWHGRQPFEWYRTCEHRFNSEFGFQSFPEPKTTHGYTEKSDRNITSPVMEHHQRSRIGNTAIMQYMLDWFRLPDGFDNTLWVSQILQGMAMKYAVEHWRRSMPRGMGTLYWQLNDNWPVASWASIDYHHRWKALHWMARRFYNNLLVSALEDAEKGTVEIHITSDEQKAINGKLGWVLTDTNGTVIVSDISTVKIPAGKSRKVETLDLSDPREKYGDRKLLLWMELSVKGEVVSTNLTHFARPKQLELADPAITATVKEEANNLFTVRLKAKKPALWAWLELKKSDAVYSDNFVNLRPGADDLIVVMPEKEMSLEQFKKQLVVRSLIDTFK